MSKFNVGDTVIVTGNTPKKEVSGTLEGLLMSEILDAQDLFIGKSGRITKFHGSQEDGTAFADVSFTEFPKELEHIKRPENTDNSSAFYIEDLELANEERGE